MPSYQVSLWTNSRFLDYQPCYPSCIFHRFSDAFCISLFLVKTQGSSTSNPPTMHRQDARKEDVWFIGKWKKNVFNIGMKWLLFLSNRILISCSEPFLHWNSNNFNSVWGCVSMWRQWDVGDSRKKRIWSSCHFWFVNHSFGYGGWKG